MPSDLRFGAGERVRCRVAPTQWAPGCVVRLFYREDEWPAGRVVPYQVELDDGRLIFAPADTDHLIRSEASFEELLYEDERQSEREQEQYREDIRARFPRKHAAIYEPAELPRFLEPALREALSSGNLTALRSLWTEESRGLFSLRLLSAEFCELLLEECEHFEAWCEDAGVRLHRPNTMNNHGAILDDFGLSPMMDALMRQVVQPLATLAGYADVGGDELLTHHAFLVSYEMGKDTELSFHVDSSDVTLNVCLGRAFEGGGLFFRGVRCRAHQQTGAAPAEQVSFAHRTGVALLHRGHHRHGAHPITSGARHNLILWCRGDPARSSEGANHRSRPCEKWCWLHGTQRA